MNLPMPANGTPSRGEPCTTGKVATSTLASARNPAGEITRASMSAINGDKSRNWPSPSNSAGFS